MQKKNAAYALFFFGQSAHNRPTSSPAKAGDPRLS
jgi:hypothetical protein